MTYAINWGTLRPIDANDYPFPSNLTDSQISSVPIVELKKNHEMIFSQFCPNTKCSSIFFTKSEIENWFVTQFIAGADTACPFCKQLWLSKNFIIPKELYALISVKNRLKIWMLSNQQKNLYLTACICLSCLILPISLYFYCTLPKNDPLYKKFFPSLIVFATGLLLFSLANLFNNLQKLLLTGEILTVLGVIGSIYSVSEELFRF